MLFGIDGGPKINEFLEQNLKIKNINQTHRSNEVCYEICLKYLCTLEKRFQN